MIGRSLEEVSSWKARISPDLRTLALLITGKGIELRRVEDNSHIRTINGYWNWLVVFSPDGTLLAAGYAATTYVGNISVLRIVDGKELFRADLDGGLSRFYFTPDGRYLAETGCPPSLWEIDRGLEKKLPDIPACGGKVVPNAAFSPNGEILATFGTPDNSIGFWKASDGQFLRKTYSRSTPRSKPRSYGLIKSIAFTPDGQVMASASDGFVSASGKPDYSQTLQLWKVSDGSLIHTLAGHVKTVNCVAFNYDGQILASGSSDGTIRLWKVK